MAMANDSTNSMGSSGMFDVYIVLFTFLAHFWLFAVILVHTTFTCLLLCGILHNKFHLIRTMHFLLSVLTEFQRQYAPNKQCALNNNVHLITRFYGT